jgi:hypothetical protein
MLICLAHEYPSSITLKDNMPFSITLENNVPRMGILLNNLPSSMPQHLAYMSIGKSQKMPITFQIYDRTIEKDLKKFLANVSLQ